MPLYIADYLVDTGHLSAAEHGGYLMLIMHYWRHGGLPSEDAALMRASRMTAGEWKRSRDTLAGFFNSDWTHDRVDAELLKSDEKSERRREAGGRGGAVTASRPKPLKTNDDDVANATQMPQQKRSKDVANGVASSSHTHLEDKLRSSSKTRTQAIEAFAEWYAVYPHKVGRGEAEKAFGRAWKSGVDLPTLISATRSYIASKAPDRSWCNPATWLNQKRWLDQPAAAPMNGSHVRAGPINSRDRNTPTEALESFLDRFDPDRADRRPSPDWDGPTLDLAASPIEGR